MSDAYLHRRVHDPLRHLSRRQLKAVDGWHLLHYGALFGDEWSMEVLDWPLVLSLTEDLRDLSTRLSRPNNGALLLTGHVHVVANQLRRARLRGRVAVTLG